MTPRIVSLGDILLQPTLMAQLERLTTHDENTRSDMWSFLHSAPMPFRWAIILEEEGVVVGWACVYGIFLERLYADVFVDPEHRGNGYGRTLVHEVVHGPLVTPEPTDSDQCWWGRVSFSDVPFYRHVLKDAEAYAIVRDGVALIRVPRIQATPDIPASE